MPDPPGEERSSDPRKAVVLSPDAPLYIAGISHFNAREFFEAHEVWEDLWRTLKGPDREFLQGLIHAAVSLLHFERGKLGSAVSQYSLMKKRLSPHRPRFRGLDVDEFLEGMGVAMAQLEIAGPEATVRLDVARIPTIRLVR